MMEVKLKRKLGEEVDIVNAARVSFGKETDEVREKDIKLMRYLAKHGHEIPFAHVGASVWVKAPLFVRSQLFKHKVGFVESEISRRYVSELEFWWPEKGWRKGSPDVKQGSLDERLGEEEVDRIEPLVVDAQRDAIYAYNRMLEAGVCKEQARMVLPQNLMTQWRWTGSLLAYARVWKLRASPKATGAQEETKELVEKLDEILGRCFPNAWTVLKEEMV